MLLFCMFMPNWCINHKNEKAENNEEEKKAYDLYDLINKDYTLIDK